MPRRLEVAVPALGRKVETLEALATELNQAAAQQGHRLLRPPVPALTQFGWRQYASSPDGQPRPNPEAKRHMEYVADKEAYDLGGYRFPVAGFDIPPSRRGGEATQVGVSARVSDVLGPYGYVLHSERNAVRRAMGLPEDKEPSPVDDRGVPYRTISLVTFVGHATKDWRERVDELNEQLEQGELSTVKLGKLAVITTQLARSTLWLPTTGSQT